MTLTTELNDGVMTVRDSDGGVWWPDDEALAEIKASDDPEACALLICETDPMRGEWRA